MQNNQNHQLCKCSAHHLSLKALQKERRTNLNAALSMCRGKQTKNKKNKSNCLSYEGPVFNRDQSYATPAFILPSQKIDYLQSARQILRQHEKRVKEAQQDLQELYVPKPRSKNMYCNVCRQNYEEYLDHINSQPHKMSIRNAEFNGHILELQNKIKNNCAKNLAISSKESAGVDEMEESVQIVGMSGRKKIKTEVQEQYGISFYAYCNQPLNFNPFTSPSSPLFFAPYSAPYNPYFQSVTSKLLFGANYLNRLDCRQQNTFMGQQSYPLFCVPIQTAFSLDAFQQA